jgi:transcriptional regulator with XRE-family HTH domain
MNRLREFRDKLGWSQQRLADATVPATSQAQIDRLEKGERKLTVEWARRLAKALGCHWTEIYDDEGLDSRTAAMARLFETLAPNQQAALFELARSMAPAATDASNDDAHPVRPMKRAGRG